MDNRYDFGSGRFTGTFSSQIRFDLDIRKPITQVLGDSATGKTLLVNYIKADKDSGRFNALEDYPNVIAYDNIFLKEDLKDLRDTLIIIDRGDLILTDELVDFICRDKKNSYLIFARTTLPLGLSPNYYGEFITEGDRIILKYMFSEVGWF